MSNNSSDPRKTEQLDNPYAPPVLLEKKVVRPEPDESKDYFMRIWTVGVLLTGVMIWVCFLLLSL